MAIGKTLLPIQPPVPKYTVDIFTASGTYTKPANLDYAYVFMQSSGGGGGSGRRGAAGSNRGGGLGNPGGNVALANFLNSDLSATETVTIGAAGAGGAAISANNTNGANGLAAGNTSFRSAVFFNVLSPLVSGTITNTITTLRGSLSNVTCSSIKPRIVGTFGATFTIGNFATDDRARGNCINPLIGQVKTIRDAGSAGGQISSANAQTAGGPLGGFYNTSNALTGAMAGTAAETAASQPSVFMTFGEFLNQIFPWFDAADANYNIGRNGLGGGCGNTAGTVAGLAGSQGVHYGAGGGGGGASTNGANSGAGAAGTAGIVIIINVLTS
jgi:hypothetical protein